MKKPLIGITMGDPAGVGPELCLRVLSESTVLDQCVPVVFGDAGVLRRVAGTCGLPAPDCVVPLKEWTKTADGSTLQGDGRQAVVDCDAVNARDVRPGEIRREYGRAAYTYIETAVNAAMAGHVAAISTAPIHKESLRLAEIPHPGHTEILAALTGAERVCMMMTSEAITVSLATIHIPVHELPERLTHKSILDAIELTFEAMRWLGKASPRIVVCALNPHGGENGLFGHEEQEIIGPAVLEARAGGYAVEGPIVPDTAFLPERRKEVDAYVVMYHDQGLIPFKMLAFDEGVNITLGLPIIRTSVDHGTAFDIAWQGKASAKSLIQSVLWAVRLQAGPRSC